MKENGSSPIHDQHHSADVFLSLGCMEGIYEPIVTPVLPEDQVQRYLYSSGSASDALHSLGSMEGIVEPLVERVAAAEIASRRRVALLPGFLIAGGVTALAYMIHFLPIAPFRIASEAGIRYPISSAIIAILLGLSFRNLLPLPGSIKAGCKSIVRNTIPFAIVFAGAGLNLAHVYGVGINALVITVVCLVFAVFAGYYIGRWFGLGPKTAMLLGAGTGICGNSAIVAVAPLIDAEDDDIALSVGTVNLFGLLAMLVWPVIGNWMSLSDEHFGVWSGTSIHAVPQVVAAGFAYSPDAGALATLVKLVRVALLAPLVFVLAVVHAKQKKAQSGDSQQLSVHYSRLVPWFVWGFLVLAIMNTMGLIPTLHFDLSNSFSAMSDPTVVSVGEVLKKLGKILLTMAMAAIGLEVNVRQLMGVGGRAVSAGFVSTLALGVVSLILIILFL